MATEEALVPSSCGEKRKEAVVSFMTTDSKDDASEKTKMKILLTTSMSSSRGEVISFVDYEDKTEFMTLKPREISIIEEPGKKYLCLEYGPKRKAKFILLDFTDESREKLDEWNDFLCRMMGLEVKPQRRNTENHKTLQRPKLDPTSRTPRTATSAFLPSTMPIFEPANASQAPQTPDDVFEEQPCSGTASGSGSESPGGESLNGDSASDYSSFGSLKSTCSMTDTLYDCPKDLLSQHQFKDFRDEIVVTQSVPDSRLHAGDTIALRPGEGSTPKNVKELREYIRTTEAPTILLAVTPGVEITMKDGEQELTINIRGPKTQRPDAVEVALKACNTATHDQTRLAIAEINNTPIPVGTQEDQVAHILTEALRDSTEGHLHLIPRSLMTAESDVEVLDDEEPDNVQEAWPINIEDSSNVSANTNTTVNEETDC